MFFSQVPLSAQLIIGGLCVAFDFGASALLLGFAKRAIGRRLAKRVRF